MKVLRSMATRQGLRTIVVRVEHPPEKKKVDRTNFILACVQVISALITFLTLIVYIIQANLMRDSLSASNRNSALQNVVEASAEICSYINNIHIEERTEFETVRVGEPKTIIFEGKEVNISDLPNFDISDISVFDVLTGFRLDVGPYYDAEALESLSVPLNYRQNLSQSLQHLHSASKMARIWLDPKMARDMKYFETQIDFIFDPVKILGFKPQDGNETFRIRSLLRANRTCDGLGESIVDWLRTEIPEWPFDKKDYPVMTSSQVKIAMNRRMEFYYKYRRYPNGRMNPVSDLDRMNWELISEENAPR